MADVNKLAFSIVKFLKDQTTQESLSEDAIESLEGEKDIIYLYLLVVFTQIGPILDIIKEVPFLFRVCSITINPIKLCCTYTGKNLC